jgi:hypothetical protein
MLTFTPLSPHSIAIVAEGHFTAADIAPALDRLSAILDTTPQLDILADVRGSPSIAPSVIIEELKHLPLLIRLIRAIDRVAIVADAEWIRTASRIESALIPGVHYEVYERKDEAHARAWLLRETNRPRPD